MISYDDILAEPVRVYHRGMVVSTPESFGESSSRTAQETS